jgi:CspA family cold shock protein
MKGEQVTRKGCGGDGGNEELQRVQRGGQPDLPQSQKPSDGQVVKGRVKWFDPAKGFGFVVAEGVEKDILLHANVLKNFGQSTVADGTGITIRASKADRGWQAIEVLKIEPLEGGVVSLGEVGALTVEQIAALPMEAARVKWFDPAKGFGFANVFGRDDDVFIHVEVLRVSGFADLASGEAVALRIVEGKRGWVAVQVASWDSAVRDASSAIAAK